MFAGLIDASMFALERIRLKIVKKIMSGAILTSSLENRRSGILANRVSTTRQRLNLSLMGH